MELDRFDRQLLNLVQADSAQTAERLAEQVEMSPRHATHGARKSQRAPIQHSRGVECAEARSHHTDPSQ